MSFLSLVFMILIVNYFLSFPEENTLLLSWYSVICISHVKMSAQSGSKVDDCVHNRWPIVYTIRCPIVDTICVQL